MITSSNAERIEAETIEAETIDSAADDAPEYAGSLLQSLMLVAELEGRSTSRSAIIAGLPLENGELPAHVFLRAANRAGLAARLLQRELTTIPREVLPAIIRFRDGRYGVLSDVDTVLGIAVLMSPLDSESHQLELGDLQRLYAGDVYYLRPMQRFDQRTAKIYRPSSDHWFWGVIKSSSGIYRDVLVASFFINLFVLAQPLFVMNVYDRVVPNNAIETLWALAVGVFIVYIFDALLKTLRSYFVELAAKRSDVILSSTLFERALGLKMQFRPVSVGAFVNRLQDFESIRTFITSTCILALIDLPFLLIFLLFIAYLGGWLVMVPVIAIPLALGLGYHAQRRLRPIIQKVMTGSTKKSATLVEGISALETVKTLGAEGHIQRSWEQAVGYVSQWSLQARKTSNATLFKVQLLQQLAGVGVVVWGVYLIANQELTMGGLIACVLLSSRALAPLAQVASLITNYDHAEATLRSLNDIMASPVEREEHKRFLHKPRLKGEIQFKQVSFAYNEQLTALEGVSLSIRQGEKVAIIGRIGSGKSTLGKLAIRLYEPQKGAVLVDGLDV
ncbi:MAG: ABC transporter transmembrane domain-containing protein, partial [Porticoccaceae bacterium]